MIMTRNRRAAAAVLVRDSDDWGDRFDGVTRPSRAALGFYRAMHCSAKRGLAIACLLSVRLSVCDVGGS